MARARRSGHAPQSVDEEEGLLIYNWTPQHTRRRGRGKRPPNPPNPTHPPVRAKGAMLCETAPPASGASRCNRNATLSAAAGGAASVPTEDGGATGGAVWADDTAGPAAGGVEALFDQIYVFPPWGEGEGDRPAAADGAQDGGEDEAMGTSSGLEEEEEVAAAVSLGDAAAGGRASQQFQRVQQA